MSLTATMPRSRSRAAAMRPRQDLTPSPAGERQSEPRFCSRLLEHFADALMILPDQAGAACPMWLVYHCREVHWASNPTSALWYSGDAHPLVEPFALRQVGCIVGHRAFAIPTDCKG